MSVCTPRIQTSVIAVAHNEWLHHALQSVAYSEDASRPSRLLYPAYATCCSSILSYRGSRQLEMMRSVSTWWSPGEFLPLKKWRISAKRWRGGATGRASDLRSTGRGFKSYSGQKLRNNCWASCSHLCASVTKQYNLVPAKERWCAAAGKVTAGLAKSNGSLPPGGWLIVTCGLTACTLDKLRGPNAR